MMGISAGTVLLVAGVLLCAVTTLGAFARPVRFAALLGLDVANPGGVNEIRSQYAGFFLMVGLVFAAALTGSIPRAFGYMLGLVVFGGLFIGRLSGLVLNRGTGGYPPVVRGLVLVDLTGCALSLAALHGAGAVLA